MRLTICILVSAMGLACAIMNKPPSRQRPLRESIVRFANNFYKKIPADQTKKNLIFSPFTIHMAVSMLACGAGGYTAQQMIRSLQLPDISDLTLQGFEKIVADFRNAQNVTLTMANGVFVASGTKCRMGFKRISSTVFRSEFSALDIKNPKEAAGGVNNWVERNTNGKIKEVISNGDIDGGTRMILVNAIYFKGNWAQKFDERDTIDMTFHIDEKNEKQVPAMHRRGSYVYGYLEDLKAEYIVLPYENNNLKMVILVPQDINGLGHIEANLKNLNIDELTNENLEPDMIRLFLPKFRIESEINLEETLTRLGITDMFDDIANFAKVSEEPLYVRKAIHKAFIEVNEEGNEAAAVTAMEVVSRMMLPELKVDRPFYFEIVYNTIPIFAGHVMNPMVHEAIKQPREERKTDKRARETSTVEIQKMRRTRTVPYELESRRK